MLWVQDHCSERDRLFKEPREDTQGERLKQGFENHQEIQPLAGEEGGMLI